MKRKDFENYVNNTAEIVSQVYKDKAGDKPTIKETRLLRRKALLVTFWHGIDPTDREDFLTGRIKCADVCGYPVIFDNHTGGGEVDSFTIIWTDKIY